MELETLIAEQRAFFAAPKDPSSIHVLVVDDLVPDPLFGAGYPRAQKLIFSLVDQGCLVTFTPMKSKDADLLRMRQVFGRFVDFKIGDGASGLERVLQEQGADFNAIIVSRPDPMRAFLAADWSMPFGAAKPPVIYDAEALATPREALRRALFDEAWSDREYDDALRSEMELVRAAEAIITVGSQDRRILQQFVTAPIFTIRHATKNKSLVQSLDQRRDLLFVGRLTGPRKASPNVDSVLWFWEEVRPLLDELIGTDYRLHVAGLQSSSDLRSLWSDRVIAHGVVADLGSLYSQCKLFIAPTRYAAGIPLKLVEAMGYGLPCVATPLLAEQLSGPQDGLLTGETPDEFAAACSRLYVDDEEWHRTRDRALRFVSEEYSAAVFDRDVAQLVEYLKTIGASAD